jgi:transposase
MSKECAIGMLTAGMSIRVAARELNVNFSTINHLQRCFREFGGTSNRLHKHRPRVTTPAQDLHIRLLHLQDCLRPATRTAVRMHNQSISAQTVRNRLREAHLHACCELFTDESRFQLHQADGRQCVWRCLGERFADVMGHYVHNIGGGRVMVLAGISYGQWTHFIDGNLYAQRYRNEILRPIAVPFIGQRVSPTNIYSSKFAQPLKGSGSTFHSLINTMQRKCVALHEANGGHVRYWMVFWSMPLLFLRYLWPKDPYL